MSTVYGAVRVLSPSADAGRPAPGHILPEQHLVFPIATEMITLGSDLPNAIVLFDPAVEREHALLRYQRGVWTIENLAEQSILTVEDVAVPPQMMASIAPGQCFQLGTTRLQLVAPDLPLSLMVLAEEGPYATNAPSISLLQAPRTIWRLPRGVLGRAGAVIVLIGFCVAFALLAVTLGTLITHRVLSGDWASVVTALTIPLIPAAGVVALIAMIDRYEREPWHLLLCAFLWGAIVASTPAIFIETNSNQVIAAILPHSGADSMRALLTGLNAGIIEEAAKGAGLLVLLLIMRERFENITDGILYGAIIGAGFAMTENIVYFVNAESRQTLVFLIVGRVILGWLGHSTFTACFGAGLGFMRERRAGFRPWLPPLVGFLAAVALHSLFDFIALAANAAYNNSPNSPLVNVVTLLAAVGDYIPLLSADVVLGIMLARSLAREAGVLREYLVDEVRQGIVTPDEYVVLLRASASQRLQRALLLARGARLWWATRSLYAAEVGLAFAKWHAALPPGESGAPFTPPSAFRARIRRLRRMLRAAMPPDAQRASAPLSPYGMRD
jgi:RsiW-degrading membrane proteinase PrsW (M82 family)